MLYKQNNTEKLSEELFKHPTSEYRGAPFWAWNCKLDKDVLLEQIEFLKEMGFGGFHMHSRAGMATEYLSEDFFSLINACVDKAKEENMLAYLYDEDKWPSGFAGGLVTKDRKYRGRYVLFTKSRENDVYDFETAKEKGLTYLLACYDIELSENGFLKAYKRIDENESAEHSKWYAYVKTLDDDPWYNNQAYVDTLSKEAIDKFIELTHEGYKKHVGREFGETIPSIFCDEPNFKIKEHLSYAAEDTSAKYPWTPLLPKAYFEKYGEDITLTLPEIFWDLPDNKPSLARYRFHDIVCELFVSSFMDSCGNWCSKNGISLTGHVLEEPTLTSQTRVVGEAMRAYRNMGIPGIDMLCNEVELTTAKQAQSAVHQYGREGMMSELYGVTKWDFDFRGHKFQGDWQAALGVTLRVPHLAWVSMKGRAKRDYPASISYQSPWYKEYPYIEDHYARLNTILTRGKPVEEVAVIHPIESCWLRYGPFDTSSDILSDMDSNFENITKWLLFGMVDFDFVSEALLAENGGVADNSLRMGEMRYGTVIVPNCETIRRTTFESLKKFRENGGNLIFVGECPKYIDAAETYEVKELFNKSVSVPMNKSALLGALTNQRFIDVKTADGSRTDNLIYTLRSDNDVKWLFIAHAKMPQVKDAVPEEKLKIILNGEFTPRLYDTVTGTVKEMNYEYKNGKTVITASIYAYDSLLIELSEGMSECRYTAPEKEKLISRCNIGKSVEFSLEEPNVYLLDMAEYSINGGEFSPEEEIRRIDSKCREVIKSASLANSIAQPWVIKEEKTDDYVTLRYSIESEIDAENILLACEEADCIEFNGEKIELSPVGYYVDRSIHTYRLPALKKGMNTLIIKVPFGARSDLECAYLLGNFGVEVSGREKCITKMPEKISFGSITAQGMPFYGGNITYKFKVNIDAPCRIKIKAAHYRGSLIKVSINSQAAGRIVYAPYEFISETMEKGEYEIELTLFGNRANTFGALHNYGNMRWYDGSVWSPDETMSYEYILEDTGILSSPIAELTE